MCFPVVTSTACGTRRHGNDKESDNGYVDEDVHIFFFWGGGTM